MKTWDDLKRYTSAVDIIAAAHTVASNANPRFSEQDRAAVIIGNLAATLAEQNSAILDHAIVRADDLRSTLRELEVQTNRAERAEIERDEAKQLHAEQRQVNYELAIKNRDLLGRIAKLEKGIEDTGEHIALGAGDS